MPSVMISEPERENRKDDRQRLRQWQAHGDSYELKGEENVFDRHQGTICDHIATTAIKTPRD